ncbi:conjugal transfer protein TraH [Thiorhodococcus mannitoliphagus]|uniref:Conjugal transfer protein TraH n=1 Tax=Thiorhodococcus mannitoliphagus TaxID=329406 RepID=A0A6P1DW25_9GAMM|nr:conjugal transfer protein TraH [Thiorhodococcus mannitoliphagus]NEX19884.1 conjugal transfer protein TraH [Thiorhodococcus mannitoliphagus]
MPVRSICHRCLLFVVALALVVSTGVQADLDAEMEAMFGTLVNVTEPTAHMGQRRGVLSAGSVVARNRIVDTNLVSFVPPSFEAGCGGIDLFGGSFSFINVEQFTNLLRSIASNAAGYAFQLALTTMAPSAAEIIEQLQKKVQQMNQLFGSSCQLAQGIVNDTASALTGKRVGEASLLADLYELGDVFENRSTVTGKGPLETVYAQIPAAAAEQFEGNLVWKALTDAEVEGWYSHGDQALLEALMSLTGSLVVGSQSGGLKDAPDGGLNLPTTFLPPTLTVSDLLYGSGDDEGQQVVVWRCASLSECRDPTKAEITLEGLVPRVRALLVGDASRVGLIDKFRLGVEELSAEEKGFMEHAPLGLGGGIRTLARLEPGMAQGFADRAVPMLAVEMLQTLVRDLLTSVRLATGSLQHTHTTQLLQHLDAVREDIWTEYSTLAQRYGNPNELLETYRNLLAQYKAPSYLDLMQAAPVETSAEAGDSP